MYMYDIMTGLLFKLQWCYLSYNELISFQHPKDVLLMSIAIYVISVSDNH